MLRTLRAARRLAILTICIALTAACAEPPNKEMNQAQGAIDAARAAGADQYASRELNGAIDALKRSEDAVAQYDYRLALSHAIDSRERAQAAAKAAVDNRAQARGTAERIVAEANSAVTQGRAQLSEAALAKLPRRIAADTRQALDSADKQMQEARAALQRDEYDRAVSAAKAAMARIQETLAVMDKAATAPPPRKRR